MSRAICRGEHDRGFTMIELVIVIAIIFVISAIAIIKLSPTQQQQQANAAMAQIASQLRVARELAVTQRRYVQVQFIGNNQIRLTRLNLPAGVTILSTVQIQTPVTFALTPGLPDTPDAFGNKGPIEFGGVVGGPPTMMFQSDGTFVDTAGNLTNGTVFLGMVNEPSAARAVTLVGSTGRIRMWRNNAAAWIQ
jgi:prepilin-type N-terminal cleavage/methylation domain-containing protein